jgi:hypothetical protein
MLLRVLPLISGVVPFVGIFVAYWLGASSGVLPSCIPFLDGCVSISATGRNPPGSFLFRAILLPQSALLAFIWYFTALWLQTLDNKSRRFTYQVIVISGMISAVALIIYVTFLGTKTPLYEFMRRFGIYFFFAGMALSELIVASTLLRIARVQGRRVLQRLAGIMLWLCVLPFILGLLNLLLKAIFRDVDDIENQIEWIAAMLMHAYLVVLYLAWRETGIDLQLRVKTKK